MLRGFMLHVRACNCKAAGFLLEEGSKVATVVAGHSVLLGTCKLLLPMCVVIVLLTGLSAHYAASKSLLEHVAPPGARGTWRCAVH